MARGVPADLQAVVALIGLAVAIENLAKSTHPVFVGFERMEFMALSLIVQRTVTAAVGIAALLAGGGVVAVSCVYLGGSIVGFAVAVAAMLAAFERLISRDDVALVRDTARALRHGGAAGSSRGTAPEEQPSSVSGV